MNLEELIEKQFGDEYKFLKLLECFYDKSANLCTFVFMYPEDMEYEDESSQSKLSSYLISKLVDLSCNIDIKFKKSYLEENLIKEEILNFLQENHKSLCDEIGEEEIEIIKDNGVSVNIIASEKIFQFLNEDFSNQLKIYLENRFFSMFSITKTLNDEIIDDLEEFEERINKIEEQIVNTNLDKVKRYNVNLLENISGREFVPKPEYIGNIKDLKTSVIISGIVSNLTQKSFIAKKGRYKGQEKHYLTFNINDGSGSFNCIYFLSRTSEKKAFTICDGSHLAVLGDMQKGFNNRITFSVKSAYFCIRLPDEIVEEQKAEVVELKDVETEHLDYKYVIPKEYIEYTQNDFFYIPPKYHDFIMNNTFVVYDVETTGLDHNNCDITEIGAVKIEKGVITQIFQTLVKPTHDIPDKVVELTHITNEMVSNCNSGEEIIKDFYLFCKDSILSGYNIINFDQLFINKLGERANLNFNNEVIDVFNIAKEKLSLRNYKLSTVVNHFNIKLIDAHRALNDALATAKALLKFYEI